jgi:hypothetical protein
MPEVGIEQNHCCAIGFIFFRNLVIFRKFTFHNLKLSIMNIKDLNNYVLFVFKDETNDRIASTTDIEALKEFTSSESFKIGQTIKMFDEDMIIKDIQLSNVTDKVYNNYKFGWSAEGIEPQGTIKDSLFRVTITIEEPLS